MNKSVFAVAILALAGAAGITTASDMTAVNAYQVNARFFNDFASSVLTINGVNQPVPATYPLPLGPLHINEQFPQGTSGNFANKHIGWFSTDGGASIATTNVAQSWTLNFDVNLSQAAPGGPRKEAGIEIHQPRPGLGFTDEGQVLIAGDNGEVAVFGATLPFTGFGAGAYTTGTTAHVQFNYFAPGVVDVKGAYQLLFLDAVTGLHDSGYKIWGTEPDGIIGMTDATVGLKLQNQRNPFINDFGDALYNGVSIVPAPGAAALLGLAGLMARRRRR